ncbi:Isochorismatase-like protein [Aspergillus undulatus]|uniref:Isochorismatase-like protein n=1 Tax=Aspergillus undulatus TaxID=1810928 RepID=UPI003CCD5738
MPPAYKRLDTENCVFLFVDHQSGLIQLVRDFDPHEFKTNTGPNGPIVKEITDTLPEASGDSTPGSDNCSGVLTEICVAFPALSLIEQGYEVFVVTDCSGTFADHTREAAHKRMAQADCQLLNWAAVAAELHRDWRRDIAGFGAI